MSSDPKKALKKSLLRNLSGLEIEIVKEKKNSLKYALDRQLEKDSGDDSLKYFNSMSFDDIKTMDLVKDNILSKDSRFLLLISEKSMLDFLINIIKQELEKMNKSSSNSSDNKQIKQIKYVNYIGSPLKGDRINVSYQTEMIVNIEKNVAKGKVIILSNLDQIYSIFYDLFNQNYIIKKEKKYCRISHRANIQKLAEINEDTKFIILVDKNDLRKQKLTFLSRFEKHIITFDALNYNFVSEFTIFIENRIDIIEKIKKIILPQIGKTENIVNLIIENKTINQNTIDFISAILMYMKDGFNEQLEIFLKKNGK